MLRTLSGLMCWMACVVLSMAQSQSPNILFVYCDDHAQAAIGAYGSRVNQTPSIDRLAREGMLFENSFVTNSICAPARAVIQTGLFSHLNGVMDNGQTFDGSQVTMPKLLHEAGYQTAVIGKWHLKTDPQGFDYWAVLIDQGPYYNPRMLTSEGEKYYEGYTTDIITDRALEWLDARDDDRPFLLMYQHKAPHRNWMPEPEYFGLYEDVKLPEPETLFDDYEGRASGARNQEMTIARHMTGMYDLKFPRKLDVWGFNWEQGFLDGLTESQREAWKAGYAGRAAAFEKLFENGEPADEEFTKFKYQCYMQDYLRSIASVDDNLGRVLDYLDQSGLAENTIVVYSSDQGFYLGEHGWFDKRWMYEQSLRTPLIVRWPGQVQPGSRCAALVQNLDMAPTFLNAAGAEIPRQMQGKSLVPLLKAEADEAGFRDAIYYHYYEYPEAHRVPEHFGVRTDRYKLVCYYTLNEWELFDLSEDPNEMHSVYADPAYADVRAQLEQRLAELQLQYDDTNPTADPSELVQARKMEAIQRTPTELAYRDGMDAEGLDPSWKPMVVGARVTTPVGGGVIVAQGGENYGYSLYFADRTPCFALRNSRKLFVVRGRKMEPSRLAHVAGVITPEGALELWVNGYRVSTAEGCFLSARPGEGLSVGVDAGSNVGEYAGDQEWASPIEDLRIYWGSLSEDGLRAWVRGS